MFESGAILQYLGRKFGRFYPAGERARIEVEQWLFWQVGGLGPMCGQAHHFRGYAPEQVPYAIERYTNEVNRLYGVMNRRLADRDFLAGDYSIADMACIGRGPSKSEGHGSPSTTTPVDPIADTVGVNCGPRGAPTRAILRAFGFASTTRRPA